MKKKWIYLIPLYGFYRGVKDYPEGTDSLLIRIGMPAATGIFLGILLGIIILLSILF
jgi:hypothetical protein